MKFEVLCGLQLIMLHRIPNMHFGHMRHERMPKKSRSRY